MTLHQQGQRARAEILYREVLAVRPRESNAWHLLGVVAWQKGDLVTAEADIRKAVACDGTVAVYHCNLGGVLKHKGDFAAAIEAYRQALRLLPDYTDAKVGLAEAYGKRGHALATAYQWEEAKAAFRHLLELNPLDAGALNNLAQVLHHAGESDEALTLYDRAIGIKPDFGLAQFNRGIGRLSQNRLQAGWQDLAASTKAWFPFMDNRPHLPWANLPLWDGSDLRGKKILLRGEQGIGDEILYASMISDLISQGAYITLECTDRLAPLFTRSFPEISVLPRQTPPLPLNDFDCQAVGLWLGRFLRPDFDHFPQKPYLKADAKMTDVLRARYASFGKTKIIGISWHSKTAGYGVHRSIALRELAVALPHKDVLFIDLQYGDTAMDREAVQHEFPDFHLHHDPTIDQMIDMDSFAAQIAACDAVVTIGNTAAHVAGALGVPTAVFLPIAGLTWYWFKDLPQSPWYSSQKLLRKHPTKEWQAALDDVSQMVANCEVLPHPEIDLDTAQKELSTQWHRHGMQMMSDLKLEEAKAAYRLVLAMDPNNIATLNNLAMIIQHEGHRPEARTLYDRALNIAPNDLAIRYNRSICYLTEGKLKEGWEDFAASAPHWLPMQDNRPNLPWMCHPIWDGGDLRGKNILVWGDQGIGDEIIYLGMIPELIERGAVITIECMDRLVPLMQRSFPSVTVVKRQYPPLPGADFDFHAPGMWLARCLRPNTNSFPNRLPFMKADPAKISHFRKRYETYGRKRIVGLSWYTSSYPWGLLRSIPLPDILATLDLNDMLLVDLQYGDAKSAWAEAQKAFPNLLMDHDDNTNQFYDMEAYAAQVAACDFVLTICNTTSHVAGALGVPSCILMADAGLTWYWFESGETCPWYPSITLLRPSVPDRLKRAAAMAAGGAK